MPKIGRSHQKIFLADDAMTREIDEYRFAHRYRSESAAVRDLVRAGLDAMKLRNSQTEEETILQAA